MKTIILLLITLLSFNTFSQDSVTPSFQTGDFQIINPNMGFTLNNEMEYYEIFPEDQNKANPFGLSNSDIDFVSSAQTREETQRSLGGSCSRSIGAQGFDLGDQSYNINSSSRVGIDGDMLMLDLDHGCAKDVGSNTQRVSRTTRFGVNDKGGYRFEFSIPLYGAQGMGSIFQ